MAPQMPSSACPSTRQSPTTSQLEQTILAAASRLILSPDDSSGGPKNSDGPIVRQAA